MNPESQSAATWLQGDAGLLERRIYRQVVKFRRGVRKKVSSRFFAANGLHTVHQERSLCTSQVVNRKALTLSTKTGRLREA